MLLSADVNSSRHSQIHRLRYGWPAGLLLTPVHSLDLCLCHRYYGTVWQPQKTFLELGCGSAMVGLSTLGNWRETWRSPTCQVELGGYSGTMLSEGGLSLLGSPPLTAQSPGPYFMSGPNISTFLPTSEVSATAGPGGSLTSSCHF